MFKVSLFSSDFGCLSHKARGTPSSNRYNFLFLGPHEGSFVLGKVTARHACCDTILN